jgi:hypothetical protein
MSKQGGVRAAFFVVLAAKTASAQQRYFAHSQQFWGEILCALQQFCHPNTLRTQAFLSYNTLRTQAHPLI